MWGCVTFSHEQWVSLEKHIFLFSWNIIAPVIRTRQGRPLRAPYGPITGLVHQSDIFFRSFFSVHDVYLSRAPVRITRQIHSSFAPARHPHQYYPSGGPVRKTRQEDPSGGPVRNTRQEHPSAGSCPIWLWRCQDGRGFQRRLLIIA